VHNPVIDLCKLPQEILLESPIPYRSSNVDLPPDQEILKNAPLQHLTSQQETLMCASDHEDKFADTSQQDIANDGPIQGGVFNPQVSQPDFIRCTESQETMLSCTDIDKKFELFNNFLLTNTNEKLAMQKPTRTNPSVPKYTDQVFAIALFQKDRTDAEKLIPHSSLKGLQNFAEISGWIFIPRTDEAMAYSCLNLESKYHGSLVVGSAEYNDFRTIFDYVPIHEVNKNCEKFHSIPDVGLNYIQGSENPTLVSLSAELRYVEKFVPCNLF